MLPMRIAFLTPDKLGPYMAGPAIRALELSRVLAGQHAVVLASPLEPELADSRLEVLHLSSEAVVAELLARVDLVIVQGMLTERFPQILGTKLPLVFDLYDPFFLEVPQTLGGRPDEVKDHAGRRAIGAVLQQLLCGDFFLVNSEQQKDLYLGMLLAVGRLRGSDLERVADVDELFGLVPFGMPSTPPPAPGGVRGSLPGVPRDSFVIVWPGGLWDWLDPFPLLDVVAELAPRYPQLRLLLPGGDHPNPEVPVPAGRDRVRKRVVELSLGAAVVWYPWVPYEKRGAFLGDADVALCFARPSLESRFAMRSRLLDCLWVGLPVLTNEEGPLEKSLVAAGLGEIISDSDREALRLSLEKRIEKISGRGSRVSIARGGEGADQFQWEASARELARFCSHPAPRLPTRSGADLDLIARSSRDARGWTAWVLRANAILESEGIAGLTARIRRRIAGPRNSTT